MKGRCEMSRLTEREQIVWDKRNAGLTFKQIAKDLGLCPATVSFAYRKAERKVEYEKERLKPTELEVYKRALMNSVPANFYEFEVSTKEEYIEIELDQARKELLDERK